MTPDLQKLRRFSLALGVILFSYVVAGFDPVRDADGEATVNLPLVEFKIGNPDYIPIGLVVASVWGLVLFWYYGLMLQRAPWRHRREVLREAKRLNNGHIYEARFSAEGEALGFLNRLRPLFPRFLNRETLMYVGGVSGRRITKHAEKLGETAEFEQTKEGCSVVFGVSGRQLAVAWFQDFDFYAPIWVNAIALGVWSYSVGWFLQFAVTILVLGLIGVGIYKWSARPPQPTG